MIIIPAVDIKNGKCVRLLQGRQDLETIFSDDPAQMAKKWEGEGAELIHVIDLDGAFEKGPRNLDLVKRIIEQIGVPIQVGGGIRSKHTIRLFLEIGAQRVIIGTEAIKQPKMVKEACKEFPGGIVVGIDARNGMVAIEGWTQTTEILAVDLARQFEDSGVGAIIFTDINRDGMQTGPNIIQTRRLAEAVSIPVIVAGGVSNLADIKNIISLADIGVAGVITGKALYSGTLNLREAIALTKQ